MDEKLLEIKKIKSEVNENDMMDTIGKKKKSINIANDASTTSNEQQQQKSTDANLELETIKNNLTDADKLLRDEYKLLKLDLEQRNELIGKMQEELQSILTTANEMR